MRRKEIGGRLLRRPQRNESAATVVGFCTGAHTAVGGMPDAPLMEDVILAHRLGRKYLAPMNLTVRTDASAYIRDGWFLRAGKNLWRLLCFISGRSAARLAEDYRR